MNTRSDLNHVSMSSIDPAHQPVSEPNEYGLQLGAEVV